MTRRAALESTFESHKTATQVAAALRPDNTPEIETRVDGTTVITEMKRETTGGLQATIDDYVVNLQVAAQLVTTDGDTSTTIQHNHE
ncbi:KEOPS complex subunit Pcc1 [Halovenus rubra]|uniref:KEOPS complex subunit Pcc1 n=2 Tax=Halovenus rubra TaxID=869890 RepID=A0ACC7DWX2_9EURY|nr:KEOPS complex subunit Pcc1 [Halovenus rubra]